MAVLKTDGNALKLTTEAKQRLEEQRAKSDAIKAALGTMKKIGMDVTKLEDTVKYMDEVRETLLKDFG